MLSNLGIQLRVDVLGIVVRQHGLDALVGDFVDVLAPCCSRTPRGCCDPRGWDRDTRTSSAPRTHREFERHPLWREEREVTLKGISRVQRLHQVVWLEPWAELVRCPPEPFLK